MSELREESTVSEVIELPGLPKKVYVTVGESWPMGERYVTTLTIVARGSSSEEARDRFDAAKKAIIEALS